MSAHFSVALLHRQKCHHEKSFLWYEKHSSSFIFLLSDKFDDRFCGWAELRAEVIDWDCLVDGQCKLCMGTSTTSLSLLQTNSPTYSLFIKICWDWWASASCEPRGAQAGEYNVLSTLMVATVSPTTLPAFFPLSGNTEVKGEIDNLLQSISGRWCVYRSQCVVCTSLSITVARNFFHPCRQCPRRQMTDRRRQPAPRY